MLLFPCEGSFTFIYIAGISERAKSRLHRSSSQSSNDSPKHIPNGEPERATDTGQQEQTSQNQSKPQSQNQKQSETQSGAFGKSNFFDTLDWSGSEAQQNGTSQTSEPVQEMKQPTEDEETLLGNTSDDDDGFAALRVSDDGPRRNQVSGNVGQSGNHLTTKPVHISKSESNMLDERKKKTETVDFFNMNNDSGVNKSVDNVDLLKMEKDPSNLDLLSGTSNLQNDPDTKDMFSSNNDTFDPFQAFAAKKQEPPAVSVTQPKKEDEFSTFDPFSSSGAGTSDANFFNGFDSTTQSTENTQSSVGGGGEDLMGSWETHASGGFNNSPNISRNSSSSNIAGSSGTGSFQMPGSDIPRNNSGAFQPMGGTTFQMGGANIPKTGSGTFQMGGANIPKTGSGTFQPMGGMGQSQGGFGMQGQAAGKADPFAEFGELDFFIFYLARLHEVHRTIAVTLVVHVHLRVTLALKFSRSPYLDNHP